MKKGGETVAGKKEIIKLLDKISIQLEGISRYCNHLEMEDIIRKMETISLDDLAKKKTQDWLNSPVKMQKLLIVFEVTTLRFKIF